MEKNICANGGKKNDAKKKHGGAYFTKVTVWRKDGERIVPCARRRDLFVGKRVGNLWEEKLLGERRVIRVWKEIQGEQGGLGAIQRSKRLGVNLVEIRDG